MGLCSANRFKNLCPEYIEEATAAASAEADDTAQVDSGSTSAPEGNDEPKESDANVKEAMSEAAYIDYLLENLDNI